jgi:hypothetical protein
MEMAAFHGNVAVVRALAGALVSDPYSGFAEHCLLGALLTASAAGNTAAVDAMLTLPQCTDPEVVLWVAAREGAVPLIEHTLRLRAAVLDSSDLSLALSVAESNKHDDAARALIAAGARRQ